MNRVTTGIGLWIGATVAASAAMAAPLPAEPEGAAQLAERLHQAHRYLFSADEWKALDSLLRRMKETAQRQRDGRDDAAKAQARTDHAKASEEFLAFLETLQWPIRVTVSGDKVETTHSHSFEAPGDVAAMLFRVSAGEGATICTQKIVDLSIQERPVYPVETVAKGTTWALLVLTNLPQKRSSTVIEFAPQGGGQRAGMVMEVYAATPGRLKVTVLDDETGKPTPAMVGLYWKPDGLLRQPSNGVDLSNQFDRMGHWGAWRRGVIPGVMSRDTWCVPGPFDMVVPPGEWEIVVRRGIEHIPIVESFTVAPGAVVEKTYRVKRWVNMAKRGWYSGDDHVHCRILSDDDADRLMAWVTAEDIRLANIVKMGDIERTWFEQRGWGPEFRVIEGGTVLSPGQECPRTHGQLGHTISMNTKEMVRDTDKYYLYDSVFDTVHAQGGLSGYAHVLNDGFFVHRDMSINVPKGKCDFVEVMQFAHLGTDLYYEFLNLGFKVTASAGSDVPWGGTVGEVRCYAYLGDKPFTADAWFDAMRAGRTFVSNGPMIDFHVDEAVPGDEIDVKGPKKLKVRARTWGHAGRLRPTKLEIVRNGEVFSLPTPGPDATEISIEFEIDAGDGFWIAARAEAADATGGDALKAHTTPIYVVREGLRFWKIDAVDQLVERRLGNLKEIEDIVAEAKRRNDAGELETDRTLKQLAVQGPELLKRVEAARKIYLDLKHVAEQERTRRSKASPGWPPALGPEKKAG